MSDYDDLFGEAAENASQDTTADPSWGVELKLAENERWAGRYRGSEVSTDFGDDRMIYLLEELGTATRSSCAGGRSSTASSIGRSQTPATSSRSSAWWTSCSTAAT